MNTIKRIIEILLTIAIIAGIVLCFFGETGNTIGGIMIFVSVIVFIIASVIFQKLNKTNK